MLSRPSLAWPGATAPWAAKACHPPGGSHPPLAVTHIKGGFHAIFGSSAQPVSKDAAAVRRAVASLLRRPGLLARGGDGIEGSGGRVRAGRPARPGWSGAAGPVAAAL